MSMFLTVVGNVGTAPKTSTSKTGVEYVDLRVACNQYSRENRKTTWIRVRFFDKLAERAKTAKVGSSVLVLGRPDVSVYTNRDGEPVADISLTGAALEFLSMGRKDSNAEAGPESAPEPAAESEDDLPF